MSQQTTAQVDLAKTFNAVTRTLKENQASLNEADVYNHNHGDNMVKNFQVITRALRQKKDSAPAEQLTYASQILAQRSQSGSAQMYSQGLANAAQRFQGQSAITPENAMTLVQALMGAAQGQTQAPASQTDPMSQMLGGLLGGQMGQSTQTPSSGGDLGSLLGGMMGGQVSQPTQSQVPSGGGLGDLLGGLLGGQGSYSTNQQGLDMGDLVNAGMAFFQARQQGADTVQALVQAVMGGSQMNNTAYHNQSGQLVAGTLISVLGAMLGGKKR